MTFADLLAVVIGLVERAEILEWAAASGPGRQFEDVSGVLAIANGMDSACIDRRARSLGLEEAWRRLPADRSR